MRKHPKIYIVLSIAILSVLAYFTIKIGYLPPEFYEPQTLTTINIENDSISDIVEITDSIVKPILYTNLLLNEEASPDIYKQQFINQILPAVLIVKFRYEELIKVTEQLTKRIEEGKTIPEEKQMLLDSLMNCFRANSYQNLLIRLKPHSTSLVLAQAALESGWGTSKSTQKGNNLFGIWTTPSDSNMIMLKDKISDKHVYMKKYESIDESIDHYFLTIGRNDAYLEFRNQRYNEENVYELIKHLNRYSELKSDYTRLLRIMVRANDFEKYDSYKLDSSYISRNKHISYKNIWNRLGIQKEQLHRDSM